MQDISIVEEKYRDGLSGIRNSLKKNFNKNFKNFISPLKCFIESKINTSDKFIKGL